MKALIPLILLTLAVCGPAHGQKYEFSVLGGYPRISGRGLGSLRSTPVDTDTKLKGQYSYGAVATLNTRGYYGFELGYMQSLAKFTTVAETTDATGATIDFPREDRIRIQQATLNALIYFMPAGEAWRPYITGGAQVFRYGAPRFPEWPGGGSKNYGVNWGAGLKLRLLPHVLMRFDIRDFIGGAPYDVVLKFSDQTTGAGHLSQWQGTVGIGIGF